MNDTPSTTRPAVPATTRRTDLRLVAAFALVVAAVAGTIVTLTFSPDPSGGLLQSTVTLFGIGIAIALGQVVGSAGRAR